MGKIPNLTLITFDKKLFIETMSALEKQYRHDMKCNKAFQTILLDASCCLYNNEAIENQLRSILKRAMNDDHKHSWIDYFMYELDFGKKYKKGCATRKDKTFINLKTSSALYDYLIEDN